METSLRSAVAGAEKRALEAAKFVSILGQAATVLLCMFMRGIPVVSLARTQILYLGDVTKNFKQKRLSYIREEQ
jgi:hypothetical protein